MQKMAQVVQQGGRDQRIARTLSLAQRRGLQRMLQLGHGLAAVLFAAALFKETLYIRKGQSHGME
jgi:hypothetical protein